MKPKTKIQKEVAALSKRLPKMSEAQKKYALLHSFEHIGRRSAKGIITCTNADTNGRGTVNWQIRFVVVPAHIAEWN